LDGVARNRAATNANQWYVTISRARQKVLIFTPDKSALRAQVQQAGTRELAMDLKLEKSPAVDARQSEWTRRSIVAAERIRQHEAVLASINQNQSNHQRIHL